MPTLTLRPELSRVWLSSAPSYAEARLGQGQVSVLTESSTMQQLIVGQSFEHGGYHVAMQVLTFDTSQLVGQTITSVKLVLRNVLNNGMPAGTAVRFGVGTSTGFVPGPLLPPPIGSFVPGPGIAPVVEVALTLPPPTQVTTLVGYCSRFASGVAPSGMESALQQDPAVDNISLVVEYVGQQVLGPFTFSDVASARFTAMYLAPGSHSLYGGLQMALFTSTPTRAAPGSEPGAGYARRALGPLTVQNGRVVLEAPITFGPSTGAWGTITHYGVFSNGGEYVGFGPLSLTVGTAMVVTVQSFVVGDGLLPEVVFAPTKTVVEYFPDAENSVRHFTVRLASGNQVFGPTQITTFVMDGPVAKNVAAMSFGPALSWPPVNGVVLYAGGVVRATLSLGQSFVVPDGRRLWFWEGYLKVRLR